MSWLRADIPSYNTTPQIDPNSSQAKTPQSKLPKDKNKEIIDQLQSHKTTLTSVGGAGGHGGNSIATVKHEDGTETNVFLKPFPRDKNGNLDRTEYNNYKIIKEKSPELAKHMPTVYDGTVERSVYNESTGKHETVEFLVMQNTVSPQKDKKYETLVDAKLSGGGHNFGLIATNKEVEETRGRKKSFGTLIQQEIGARIAPNFMISREKTPRHLRIFDYPQSEKHLKDALKNSSSKDLNQLEDKLKEMQKALNEAPVALIGASIIIMREKESGELVPYLIDPAHMQVKPEEKSAPAQQIQNPQAQALAKEHGNVDEKKYEGSIKEYEARKNATNLAVSSILNVITDVKTTVTAKENLQTEEVTPKKRSFSLSEKIKTGFTKLSRRMTSAFTKAHDNVQFKSGKDRTNTRSQSSPAAMETPIKLENEGEISKELEEPNQAHESDISKELEELNQAHVEEHLTKDQTKALATIFSYTSKSSDTSSLKANDLIQLAIDGDLKSIISKEEQKNNPDLKKAMDFLKEQKASIKQQTFTASRESSRDFFETSYSGDYSENAKQIKTALKDTPESSNPSIIHSLSVILDRASGIEAGFLVNQFRSIKSADDVELHLSLLVPENRKDEDYKTAVRFLKQAKLDQISKQADTKDSQKANDVRDSKRSEPTLKPDNQSQFINELKQAVEKDWF